MQSVQGEDPGGRLIGGPARTRRLRRRNVQKQSRGSSSCFAVIVAEHSAESLTPLDSGVRFANGAERPQHAVS